METNNFALRLNRLFEEKRKPDGKQYSQAEVLDGARGTLTRVYLWKLRNGRAVNPSLQVIQGLADFFAVDPGYFFETDEAKGASTENHAKDLAREISIRSARLSSHEQRIVLFIIDGILKAKKAETE